MSNHCYDRFKAWISQTTGGAIHGEVVVAELYDAAQAELSALREELDNEKARIPQYIAERAQTEQYLTAAEQRNAELVELLQETVPALSLAASAFKAQKPVYTKVKNALFKPTESGASE